MKRFLIILLNFLITTLICFLCISFFAKKIVVSTLSKEVVKKEVSSNIITVIKDYYDDVSYDTLDKIETNIGNSKEIDIITEKYFDNVVNTIINQKEVNAPKTKEEIMSIINENEKILNENNIYISGIEKEKIVDNLMKDGKIDRIYEKVVNKVKSNLSNDEIKVVKIYNEVTTSSFRWIIVCAIIILVLFIAALKKSYYRWTYNLSISFFLSGFLLSFIAPLVSDKVLVPLCKNLIGQTAEINLNSLINFGYLCFCFSALFIIIYIIGNKISGYYEKRYNY